MRPRRQKDREDRGSPGRTRARERDNGSGRAYVARVPDAPAASVMQMQPRGPPPRPREDCSGWEKGRTRAHATRKRTESGERREEREREERAATGALGTPILSSRRRQGRQQTAGAITIIHHRHNQQQHRGLRSLLNPVCLMPHSKHSMRTGQQRVLHMTEIAG